MVRAHLLISGRVQGVMFREATRREAVARGVTGWVKNLSDGRVEAVFEGSEAGVQALIDWSHRGPSRAEVDQVNLTWENATGEFDRFEVKEGWTW